MRPIYVCLASDDNYVQLASVAIASIIKSNIQDPIEFFFLDSGLCSENKEILKKQVEEKNKKITFVSVLSELENLKKLGANAQGRYQSFAAYARFYVIDKLPDYVDKLLYVDCDTCMCSSLQELFEDDLQGNWLGAVIDILPDFHKKAIEFDEKDLYFNSGVLLFNVIKWRENDVLRKIEAHIAFQKCRYSFHDQDIINIVCKGKIKRLNPRYMVFLPEYSWGVSRILQLTDLRVDAYYSDDEIKEAAENPCIIHYVESIFGRPWYKACHSRCFDRWLQALAESPFADSFRYTDKKISLKHRMLEMAYYIMPKKSFISLYKKRKNMVLLRRESNEK